VRTQAVRLALFAAIVAGAREESRQRFPGCAFFVLLWDEDIGASERVVAALADRDIAVTRMEDVLPGYAADPARYRIGPNDKHPNPLAQDLIAAHLVKNLLPPAVRR
jgi:hypothetical protein